jgi:hypothetical protein
MAQIPNGALRFVQEGCHAFADGEDGKKQLKMTVYSGKVIRDHFYWGDLAIDLDGIKFGMSKYPVLEQHDTDSKTLVPERRHLRLRSQPIAQCAQGRRAPTAHHR